MNRNIVVSRIDETPTARTPTEMVERKGIGHPDSVADGIAEAVSRELSKFYMKEYGTIFHHNTDQVEIVGGQSKPEFGGGTVLEPVYILLSGRATTMIDGKRIPYRTIAVRAAYDQIRKNFPNIDPEEDITMDCRIGQGSVDLRGVYDTKKFLANDTSFGVGYAPFSDVERLVLETEHYINGKLRFEMKGLGEDVKVMGARIEDRIILTIAIAMVGKYLANPGEYGALKENLYEKVKQHGMDILGRDFELYINTADMPEKHVYYLTVTGLSMENGDDGSVGRGNRVNGLITPHRPMSMEAASGKNPVTHVGKLYNLLSMKIAEDIIKSTGGDVEEARVRILAQIGHPIDHPLLASTDLIMAEGVPLSKVKGEVEGVVDEWLANIDRITQLLLEGKISTY